MKYVRLTKRFHWLWNCDTGQELFWGLMVINSAKKAVLIGVIRPSKERGL